MTAYTPITFSWKSHDFTDQDEKMTPIIFMHGMTDSKETWDDILEVIAEKSKRKVYAYDARNHGDSEYTDAFNFDLNVEDLFHFMDAVNIPKAILVGHSMGSLTATNAALKKPERIEMIISEDMFIKKLPKELLDPVKEWLTAWSESVRAIPNNVKESDAVNHALDYLFTKLPDSIFGKEDLATTKYVFKRTPSGGFDVKFNEDAILRALKNPETLVSDPSGQFDGPAFFIYGNLSPMKVGSEKEHIRQHFPKAEFIEFEGADHSVHPALPEKFVETLLDLIQNKN